MGQTNQGVTKHDGETSGGVVFNLLPTTQPTTPVTTPRITAINSIPPPISPTNVPTDPLLLSMNELSMVLNQLGEHPLVTLLDEISRQYNDLSINYKKYLTCAKYAQKWLGEEDEGLFGGSTTVGSSFSGLAAMDEEDEDGPVYMTNSAFQVWVTAIKDRQLPRFKRKLEKLLIDSNGGASRRAAFSFSAQLSSSSSSLRRASSFIQAQLNPQNANFVIDMDSKQKYFEVRNEMECVLTHSLEEIKGLKECIEAKKKLDGNSGSSSDSLDISCVFSDFEFEAKWWETKIGLENFSVKKKSFIDAIEDTFGHLKIKWDIELLEEICDPTCDGVVSVIDLRSLVSWIGSIYKWNTEELKLRGIASKEDAAPVIFLPHFWGSLCSVDAQDILEKEEPGTYLIRFNEHEPGAFYISCVQEEVSSSGESEHSTFFASRRTYHFVLKRSKTDKGEPFYYLCEADKTAKHKTITDLLEKSYFLTFKYPYVNDELKSSTVAKKRDVDVFGALKSLTGEDDPYYPFMTFKGKFVVVEKKKEESKKVVTALKKNNTTELKTVNSESGLSNSSSNSLKNESPGLKKEAVLDIIEQ